MKNDLYGNGLIANQWDLPADRGSFGLLGNVRKNGCGSIAYHNILRLSGMESNYRDVLECFNHHWLSSTILGGFLGTSPFFIWNKLKQLHRFSFAFYQVNRADNAGKVPTNHDIYLNLYVYKFGSHYSVSVFRNGKMMTLNDVSASDYENYFRKTKAIFLLVLAMDRINEERNKERKHWTSD